MSSMSKEQARIASVSTIQNIGDLAVDAVALALGKLSIADLTSSMTIVKTADALGNQEELKELCMVTDCQKPCDPAKEEMAPVIMTRVKRAVTMGTTEI